MSLEKGLGFGWGRRARGEARGQGYSTKVLVQASAPANRCAGSTQALQTCDASNPFPSGTARCWVGLTERSGQSCVSTPGDTTRWKAPWVERPFGSAGKSGSTRRREREGRQLPVGLEPKRRCPRGDRAVSEIGFVSVKAPPAVAMYEGRGGSASRAPRGVTARECSNAVLAEATRSQGRGCTESRSIEASAREQQTLTLNSQTARTVLARRRGFPLRTKMRRKSSAGKPRRKTCEVRDSKVERKCAFAHSTDEATGR